MPVVKSGENGIVVGTSGDFVIASAVLLLFLLFLFLFLVFLFLFLGLIVFVVILLFFLFDNFTAQLDTFIADVNRRAGNQLFDLFLVLWDIAPPNITGHKTHHISKF